MNLLCLELLEASFELEELLQGLLFPKHLEQLIGSMHNKLLQEQSLYFELEVI